MGRPGFLGALRQGDAPERDADPGFGPDTLLGGSPVIRLGDPNAARSDGFGSGPGFDPVWGTLGAAPAPAANDWLGRDQEPAEGLAVDVEIFGNGFQISGQLQTGGFDRVSDWLNMQTGFIPVRSAWHVHLGQKHTPDPDGGKGTLWVRLNQIVLVAERSPAQSGRTTGLVVQKQRRKVSIVTPGYNLGGNIHVHAHGSMTQFLESPDPRFLPITDVTVRGLNDPELVARFPFAMVNREQLVTVLDESTTQGGASTQTQGSEPDGDMPLDRQWGAA
jgi:hypothetical protein